MREKANILSFDEARKHYAKTSSRLSSTPDWMPEKVDPFLGSSLPTFENPYLKNSENVLSYGLSDDFFNESEYFTLPRRQGSRDFERTSSRTFSPQSNESIRGSFDRSQPRAALTTFEDDAADETGRSSDKARRKKAKAKRKAEKKFNRQFGEAPNASDGGPRAAVYKAEMGSQHKKALRKQDTDAGKPSSFGFSFSALLPAITAGVAKSFSTPKRILLSSIAICLIFGCVFLYGPTKQYYQTTREHARLQVERDLVVDKANELTVQKKYLQTEDGIRQAAHSQYGWVGQGEDSATVYGLDIDPTQQTTATNVKSVDIKPPTTWYSPILDFIFDVK